MLGLNTEIDLIKVQKQQVSFWISEEQSSFAVVCFWSTCVRVTFGWPFYRLPDNLDC